VSHETPDQKPPLAVDELARTVLELAAQRELPALAAQFNELVRAWAAPSAMIAAVRQPDPAGWRLLPALSFGSMPLGVERSLQQVVEELPDCLVRPTVQRPAEAVPGVRPRDNWIVPWSCEGESGLLFLRGVPQPYPANLGDALALASAPVWPRLLGGPATRVEGLIGQVQQLSGQLQAEAARQLSRLQAATASPTADPDALARIEEELRSVRGETERLRGSVRIAEARTRAAEDALAAAQQGIASYAEALRSEKQAAAERDEEHRRALEAAEGRARESEQALAAAREDSGERGEEQRRAAEAAEARARAAEEELARAREEVTSSRQELFTARQELSGVRQDLAVAREESLAVRESSASDQRSVDAIQAQLVEARQELDGVRRGLATAGEDRAAAQQESADARRDAAAARQAAEAAQQEVAAARRETEVARQEAEAARQEAMAARQETEAARQQTEAARLEANAAREALETAHQELFGVRAELAVVHQGLASARAHEPPGGEQAAPSEGALDVVRSALVSLRRSAFVPAGLRLALEDVSAAVPVDGERPPARLRLVILDRDLGGLDSLAAELEGAGLDVKVANYPEELALLLRTPATRDVAAAICDVMAFRPDQNVAGLFRSWDKDRPGLAFFLSYDAESTVELERARRVPLSLTVGHLPRPLPAARVVEAVEALSRRQARP
jgi:chemotaxis protein histidine kinase CheA